MKEVFHTGDIVLWIPWRKKARVVEVNNRRKKVRITLFNSSFQTWTSWQNVRFIDSSSEERLIHDDSSIVLDNEEFKTLLDLHGKTVEDGVNDTDYFLHQAYVREVKRVLIIHGEGSGKLRQAIRNHLENSHLVKYYEYAHPNLGGTGVTVVYLEYEENTFENR